MKIKLLQDLPVEDKHEMKKGRILECVEQEEDACWWVRGYEGELVRVFWREADMVEED